MTLQTLGARSHASISVFRKEKTPSLSSSQLSLGIAVRTRERDAIILDCVS